MRYSILLLVILQSTLLISQDLHFHKTGGFGTDKLYGLDGDVYRVTNLNKEGEGSLRHFLEMSGPRVIVFEVGGIIDLEKSDLKIDNGQVTVAGQTAPYPGITIIKGGLRVNADEVLIQHITIRPGDGGYTEPVGWEPDGFSVSTKNVVFDHCSASWAIDENMSIARGGNNVTFYRCIISEGLSNSIHAKGEHSCGSLVMFDSKNISIIGSFYAHNFRRHPRIADGATVLYANNVIYNYGIYASHMGANVGKGNPNDPGIADFIGNAYFKGVDGWDDYMVEIHKGDFDKNNAPTVGKAYLENNIGMDRITGSPLIQHDENVTLLTSRNVTPEAFQPYDAYDNIELVLKRAGSRPKERSFEDSRIVQSLVDGTGSIIDSQNEVGGYPAYDSTARTIDDIPISTEDRRIWLDSISTSLESTDTLNVSALYSFIDDHLTSSTENHNPIALHCYPTPVSEHLTLTFRLNKEDNVNVHLVDTAGKKFTLRNNLHCTSGLNVHQISIADYSLSNGIYVLVIDNKTATNSEKIVIKK